MKTLAMQVRNTGFLLEKLAQDCGPTQFVRELTQNSVEAIQRVQRANPDYEGRIEWDYDEQASDREHGVLKVCITDNGDGMTADEMKTHINMLSSGRAQSLGGNFGMGAKIAALAYNPHGVMYLSWREGQGALVHLWRDPDTNEFGLRQMKRADDTFGHHMELAPDAKPGLIDNHGTRVVLLGTAEDSDTTAAPEGVDAKTDWIVKTLNTRYFRFPENLEVVARTNFQGVISDQNKQRRRVNGQRYVLDKVAISRDTVEITGARVHWWLLPSDKEKWGGANKASWSRDYAILGHVAALWRDELYEMAVSVVTAASSGST